MWTSRPIARILRATLLVLPLQLGATSMAAAADWVAADVRGTVLLLVDDKWQELTAGQVLPSPATLRTLGGGRLTIQSEGFAFALGGATALRLERAGTPTISHMAGIMAFAVAPPHRMVMATPSGAVSTGGGRGRLTIANGRAVIELDAGTATAVSPDGNAIELAAGHTRDLGTPEGAAATGQAGEILPRASSESDPGHGNASDGEGPGKSAGSDNRGGSGHSRNPGGDNAASGKESSDLRSKGSGQGEAKSDNGRQGN